MTWLFFFSLLLYYYYNVSKREIGSTANEIDVVEGRVIRQCAT